LAPGLHSGAAHIYYSGFSLKHFGHVTASHRLVQHATRKLIGLGRLKHSADASPFAFTCAAL